MTRANAFQHTLPVNKLFAFTKFCSDLGIIAKYHCCPPGSLNVFPSLHRIQLSGWSGFKPCAKLCEDRSPNILISLLGVACTTKPWFVSSPSAKAMWVLIGPFAYRYLFSTRKSCSAVCWEGWLLHKRLPIPLCFGLLMICSLEYNTSTKYCLSKYKVGPY